MLPLARMRRRYELGYLSKTELAGPNMAKAPLPPPPPPPPSMGVLYW